MTNNARNCINCGLCRSVCPVFTATRKETYSPRGFSILIKKNHLSEVYYFCTLCGLCKSVCPLSIDVRDDVLKMRSLLAEKGTRNETSAKILENIKKKGSIYT